MFIFLICNWIVLNAYLIRDHVEEVNQSWFKAINAAQKYFLSSMLTLEITMAIIWNISKCQWNLFKGLHCLEATRTTLLRIIYTLPTPRQFCHPTLRWTGTWRRNVPGRVLRWPFLSACSPLPYSSRSEEGCLKGAHEQEQNYFQKMLSFFSVSTKIEKFVISSKNPK